MSVNCSVAITESDPADHQCGLWIPKVKTKSSQYAFNHHGAVLLNKLPANLKSREISSSLKSGHHSFALDVCCVGAARTFYKLILNVIHVPEVFFLSVFFFL